jgi:ankyrin repeat protein
VCEEGDVDVVKAVAERTQVDLETRDAADKTPLHMAADNGHLPVVQYLCEQGADKELSDDDGGTPLLRAAFNWSKHFLFI